jgi:hypothetical protein
VARQPKSLAGFPPFSTQYVTQEPIMSQKEFYVASLKKFILVFSLYLYRCRLTCHNIHPIEPQTTNKQPKTYCTVQNPPPSTTKTNPKTHTMLRCWAGPRSIFIITFIKTRKDHQPLPIILTYRMNEELISLEPCFIIYKFRKR